MTALELKLLGEFEARDGAGRPIFIKARKSRALLAALALAPSGAMSRDAVAGLLWSDRGDAQARSSLRQALVGLRRELAEIDGSLPLMGGDRVRLDLDRVAVDAVAFQRDAASHDPTSLRRAAALYQGEFLADSDIRDAAFEEWVASQRRRLAELAIRALGRLFEQETGSARIEVASRLVALDPLREASHRNLMRAYAEAGERGLALRQYEICREALRTQLGIPPEEETEALRRSLIENGGGHEAPRGNGVEPGAFDNKPSVAVLPFDVLGASDRLDGFSDGLTEDIITGLSRISAIRVVARNTMFAYRGRAVDVRSLGRELGVRYVLEGSVRALGPRMRVSAQLIETASGHHVWAEQIDRDHADTIGNHDPLVRAVVASVQTQVILNEGRVAAAGTSESASRLLARSWQRFLLLTEESLAEARALSERALELDPARAMAHRIYAVCLYHQVYMGFIPWTGERLDELYAHARRSIELEDADEYCHWAIACAHLLRKEHDRAIASLRRALEINPNCSIAYGSMGTVLAWSGQYDASIESNRLAIEINPQDPSVFFRHFGLTLAHYLAARYDRALGHARAVVQTRPAWWLGQMVHLATLRRLGKHDEAARALDEFARLRPDIRVSSLKVLPFASDRDRDHLADALREAGLPE